MPKIVDYERRKHDIMEQALRVFAEKGYYDTQLSDIAGACGMGRTSLYSYFTNKDEIFDYATRHVFEVLSLECQNILEATGLSSIERVKRIIHLIASNEERATITVLVDLWLRLKREKETVTARLTGYDLELHRLFSHLLQEGIARGEIKSLNVSGMAFALTALTESFMFHFSLKEDSVQFGLQAADELIDGLRI